MASGQANATATTATVEPRFSTIVKRVIALAEASRRYWEPELARRFPDYPVIDPDELERIPIPPAQVELQQLLESLDDNQRYWLLVVMYLGRGDFDIERFEDKLEVVREYFDTSDWVVTLMLEQLELDEYLREGQALLTEAGIDVDDRVAAAIVAS